MRNIKTLKDLLDIIDGRENYEIMEGCFTGRFHYDGTYDFEIDFNGRRHVYGKDVLEDVTKNNIPLDTEICIWDNDDFHSWSLTHEGFVIGDEDDVILLVCRPFAKD